jgi:hypothetical protein
LITTVVLIAIFLALIEYTFSVLYEPSRDLYQGFDHDIAILNYDLLDEDPDLIQRLIPDLEIPHPQTQEIMKINSHGYRGPEFAMEPAEDRTRVALLGDGTLFGMGLGYEQTPACLLGKMLDAKRTAGARPVEVIDLAVPGYTSFQGARQAETLFPRLRPDLVIVGFGYTDGEVCNVTDAEAQASISGLQRFFAHLSPYFHGSAFFQWLRNKSRSGAYRESLNRSQLDLERIVSRVSLPQFKKNVARIIDRARDAGGEALLLDPNLLNYYARDTLKDLAAEYGTPFLSAREVFEAKYPMGEYELLKNSSQEGRTLAIQVRDVPENEKSEPHVLKLIRIPLNQTRFPFMKQKEVFSDDGTDGDLHAGDGIFTALIHNGENLDYEFAPAVKMYLERHLFHLFINDDVFYRPPDRDRLAKRGLYYSPVLDFGRPSFHTLVMDFDLELPNAEGARVLSEALLEPALKILD